MKMQDRTLFSFQKATYEEQAERAASIVYKQFRGKIDELLDKLFKDLVAYTEATRNVYLSQFRREGLSNNPSKKSPLPNCRIPSDKLQVMFRDYRSFAPFLSDDEAVSEEVEITEKPLFPENKETFEDFYLYWRHLGDESTNPKSIIRRSKMMVGMSKNYPSSQKKAKLGRVFSRILKNPFYYFYISVDKDAEDVLSLFADIEGALYDNGYPSQQFRDLVDVEIPNSDVLDKVNEKFKANASRRYIVREVKRRPAEQAVPLMLEAFDGSFQDAGRYVRKLKDGIAALKELVYETIELSPDQMAQQFFTEETAEFVGFIQRNWTNLRVVNELSSLETPSQVEGFVSGLLEKHKTYNKDGYAKVEKNKKTIGRDLMHMWHYARCRKVFEEKVSKKEEMLARSRPRTSYTMVVVEEKDNQKIREEIEAEWGRALKRIPEKTRYVQESLETFTQSLLA